MHKYFITLLIIIPIFACHHNKIIYYDVPSKYYELFKKLEISLKQDFILKDISTESLDIEDIKNRFKIIRFRSDEELNNGNNLDLISKIYSTPWVNQANNVDNVEIKDISNYLIIPLKDLKIPQKGLSINGLYPSDDNYPLIENVYLERINIISTQLNIILDNYIKSMEKNIEKQPDIYWIGAVGDIMLNRGVDTLLRDKGLDAVFTNTLPILKSFNLLLGNLEGSVTNRGVQNPKSFTFRFKDDLLLYMKKAGFSYLSVVNNHVYDYGELGFKDTLENLKKYNIPTSGAGLNIKEASDYYEIDKVRILSVASFPNEKNGYNGYTQSLVTENRAGILYNSTISNSAIKNMCSDKTFDVVYVHGGTEWADTPSKDQIELYRSYIDMGVDLVIGSHPHVLQKFENYKNGFIAYSLGNFIFPLMKGWYTGEESIILGIGLINNKIAYSRIYPVIIDDKIISLDNSDYIKNRFYNLK